MVTVFLLVLLALTSCAADGLQPAGSHAAAAHEHTSDEQCHHDPVEPGSAEAAATDPRRGGNDLLPDPGISSGAAVAVRTDDEGRAPSVCGKRGPPVAGRTLLDTLGIART